MRRLKIGLAFAAMLSIGFVRSVVAQETASTPEILPAVECTVDQISMERLASVLATPIAEVPQVEASPTAIGIPEGEPADDETAKAVRDIIAQLVACINAGDTLRGLELYSDRFVARVLAGADITQEMYDAEIANLQPRAEGQNVILHEFGDVVILEDGRATVIVTGNDLQNPEDATGTLFYLVNVDDTWYIDETVEDVE